MAATCLLPSAHGLASQWRNDPGAGPPVACLMRHAGFHLRIIAFVTGVADQGQEFGDLAAAA